MERGTVARHFSCPCLLWPNGRPSQQLLSSCECFVLQSYNVLCSYHADVFTVVIFVSYFCAVRHGAAVTEWKMTWKKVRFWIQKMKKKEGIRSAEVASYDLLGLLCLLIVLSYCLLSQLECGPMPNMMAALPNICLLYTSPSPRDS